MMFKNGNGGTSLPTVAPIGVMFKLGGNVYRVVGQNGSTALVENQSTPLSGGCRWHHSPEM